MCCTGTTEKHACGTCMFSFVDFIGGCLCVHQQFVVWGKLRFAERIHTRTRTHTARTANCGLSCCIVGMYCVFNVRVILIAVVCCTGVIETHARARYALHMRLPQPVLFMVEQCTRGPYYVELSTTSSC